MESSEKPLLDLREPGPRGLVLAVSWSLKSDSAELESTWLTLEWR